MKLYLNPDQLSYPDQFVQWQSQLQQLKSQLASIVISLSMEERQGRRKMGPRRLAYAQTAERRGVQHEAVMPRTFFAAHFSRIIWLHTEISKTLAQIEELHEMLDDTLMAVGIDAMTYTKVVHDGLRSANLLNPSLDAALKELDEFNKRAQAEEVEENPLPVSNGVAVPSGSMA